MKYLSVFLCSFMLFSCGGGSGPSGSEESANQDSAATSAINSKKSLYEAYQEGSIYTQTGGYLFILSVDLLEYDEQPGFFDQYTDYSFNYDGGEWIYGESYSSENEYHCYSISNGEWKIQSFLELYSIDAYGNIIKNACANNSITYIENIRGIEGENISSIIFDPYLDISSIIEDGKFPEGAEQYIINSYYMYDSYEIDVGDCLGNIYIDERCEVHEYDEISDFSSIESLTQEYMYDDDIVYSINDWKSLFEVDLYPSTGPTANFHMAFDYENNIYVLREPDYENDRLIFYEEKGKLVKVDVEGMDLYLLELPESVGGDPQITLFITFIDGKAVFGKKFNKGIKRGENSFLSNRKLFNNTAADFINSRTSEAEELSD